MRMPSPLGLKSTQVTPPLWHASTAPHSPLAAPHTQAVQSSLPVTKVSLDRRTALGGRGRCKCVRPTHSRAPSSIGQIVLQRSSSAPTDFPALLASSLCPEDSSGAVLLLIVESGETWVRSRHIVTRILTTGWSRRRITSPPDPLTTARKKTRQKPERKEARPDLIQLLCPTRRCRSFPPLMSHRLHTPSVPPVATSPVAKSWSRHRTGPACFPSSATHLLVRRSHMRTLQSYDPDRACCPWTRRTQLTWAETNVGGWKFNGFEIRGCGWNGSRSRLEFKNEVEDLAG